MADESAEKSNRGPAQHAGRQPRVVVPDDKAQDTRNALTSTAGVNAAAGERPKLPHLVADNDASQKEMESRLMSILSIVSDWLKFAETKNAGLLVFIGACVSHRGG